uniref:Uncharacterized protein n=1 Tax=Lepisosteus oculatus TaxID=7918 RepID=W5M1Y2_LEPOC
MGAFSEFCGGGGAPVPFQIPEQFGAVRTIAEVEGEELLVGTTRNAILRGTFSGGFVAIVQGHVDELWGLATHPSHNSFLSCGYDRQVCLWNGEEHTLDWSTALEVITVSDRSRQQVARSAQGWGEPGLGD